MKQTVWSLVFLLLVCCPAIGSAQNTGSHPKIVVERSFLGLTNSLPPTTVLVSNGGLYRISVYIESPALFTHDTVDALVNFSDDYQPTGLFTARLDFHEVDGLPADGTASTFAQIKKGSEIQLSTQATNAGPNSPPYEGSPYDLYIVIEEL